MFKDFFRNIKDFFGEQNELIQATDNALKDRITSPFYGYFLISWILVNWQIVYVAVFVNQDLIYRESSLLRNEYVMDLFPTGFCFVFDFFILPALITILFFWVFPFITRIFYRKNIRNQKALRVIELQESREEKEKEKELVVEETALITKEIEKAKEEKRAEAETPEVIWEREFESFQKTEFYSKFNQILDGVYKYSGKSRVDSKHGLTGFYEFEIDTDVLAYCDTIGLISLESGFQFSLTPKGRFFARKYYDAFSF